MGIVEVSKATDLIIASKLWDRAKKANFISQQQVETMIGNQRLYNETLSDVDSDINSHKFLGAFRRMSLSIVLRTLYLMKTPQLINFNPISDPTRSVDTHELKSIMPEPSDELMEGDLVSCIAHGIAMEIDRDVLIQLRSRAGTVVYIDPTDPDSEFQDRYFDTIKRIELLTGQTPNWVVASSEIADELTSLATEFVPAGDDELTLLGLRYLGELCWQHQDGQLAKQRLYDDTFFPEHEILMGYQGKEANTTRFEPRVLLEAIPSRKPNQKVRRARLQTEFNTIWSKKGGDFYARMTVKAPD